MIDTYAVFGNPIQHSKSPFIHYQFAKQTHQRIEYLKIEVPPGEFAHYVDQFLLRKGKGFNITAPFKQEAYKIATTTTARAKLAGAANTIKVLANGELLADNTDGIGLVRDLQLNLNYSLSCKKILILGAGGVVRGILEPILAQHPDHILLANRTLPKANELAKKFSAHGKISSTSLSEADGKFDLIINAISSEDNVALPNVKLAHDALCYDLTYGSLTPFLKWAKSEGISRAVDGIGMLVEQAAESFYLWREVRPETASVIELCRSL